jgi:hypothetical protein
LPPRPAESHAAIATLAAAVPNESPKQKAPQGANLAGLLFLPLAETATAYLHSVECRIEPKSLFWTTI